MFTNIWLHRTFLVTFIAASLLSVSFNTRVDKEVTTPKVSMEFIQDHFNEVTLNLKPNTVYKDVELPFVYTSYCVVSNLTVDLSGVHIVSADQQKNEIGFLSQNKEGAVIHSNLFFAAPLDSAITIITDDFEGRISFHFYYAKPLHLDINSRKPPTQPCEKPEAIDQSEWRTGLPQPTPGRNATQVKHCVVHHSAGSNTNLDFVNVVRNIYLLHTQTNGWDDIGYNYVIAQNGTLFKGRDPEEVDDQDNIQGAHFCAKNGGTMGICLLGNYEEIPPTTASMETLSQLLTWKLMKEQLNVSDKFNHPEIGGSQLSTIVGHRDGCATACPGDSAYAQMVALKSRVQAQIKECELASIKQRYAGTGFVMYPNPSVDRFRLKLVDWKADVFKYQILSQEGKIVLAGDILERASIKHNLTSGMYIVQVLKDDIAVASRRLIVQ